MNAKAGSYFYIQRGYFFVTKVGGYFVDDKVRRDEEKTGANC